MTTSNFKREQKGDQTLDTVLQSHELLIKNPKRPVILTFFFLGGEHRLTKQQCRFFHGAVMWILWFLTTDTNWYKPPPWHLLDINARENLFLFLQFQKNIFRISWCMRTYVCKCNSKKISFASVDVWRPTYVKSNTSKIWKISTYTPTPPKKNLTSLYIFPEP